MHHNSWHKLDAANQNVKYMYLHAIKVSSFQADLGFISFETSFSTTAHSLPYTGVEDGGAAAFMPRFYCRVG